ncbi:hypothetical protein F5B19DRAFT_498809 [Rostrohypoxylon terebratum]|nr:hypothetical protein F5B19DRAFT_498809 [Rostrohypoxylon terebratum]
MMAAQNERQLPRGVGQQADIPDIPNINPHILAIEHLQRKIRQDTLTFASKCLENYQRTDDPAWLHKRRILLQTYIAEIDSLRRNQSQGREAVQAALDHPIPISNEAYVVEKEAISPDPPNHEEYVVPLIQWTPPKEESASSEPQPTSIHDKISISWGDRGALYFHLKRIDNPNHINPTTFLGQWNDRKRQWMVENWQPPRQGGDTKCHVILVTAKNLAILRRAFNFLVEYKDDLVDRFAETEKLPLVHRRRYLWEEPLHVLDKFHFDNDKELALKVIYPGQNKLVEDHGKIFFREIGMSDKEQTWCPLSHKKVHPDKRLMG